MEVSISQSENTEEIRVGRTSKCRGVSLSKGFLKRTGLLKVTLNTLASKKHTTG
jgi:hypothetical protein